MDISKITKCEFESVYNKYAPSKLEKFYFKYFSTSTLQKHLWFKWLVTGIMFIPFLIAFIGTVANSHQKLIEITTILFCVMLTVFATLWIFVWITHNCRIKKIQKKLGVTSFEYDFLVDKFYNEVDINKYIHNKQCE